MRLHLTRFEEHSYAPDVIYLDIGRHKASLQWLNVSLMITDPRVQWCCSWHWSNGTECSCSSKHCKFQHNLQHAGWLPVFCQENFNFVCHKHISNWYCQDAGPDWQYSAERLQQYKLISDCKCNWTMDIGQTTAAEAPDIWHHKDWVSEHLGWHIQGFQQWTSHGRLHCVSVLIDVHL